MKLPIDFQQLCWTQVVQSHVGEYGRDVFLAEC